MTDRNDKNERNEIVPTAPSGLAKQESSLVRRGLDDLSKLAGATGSQTGAQERYKPIPQTGIKNGKDLYRLGRYEEAIACFDRVLELLPGVIDAWRWKGVALFALDRFEEALVCFDRVIETDPNDFMARVNKGSALDELGRLDDSLNCYRRAVELRPYRRQVWLAQGKVLHRLGRLDDAMRSYDKAIELDARDSQRSDDETADKGEFNFTDSFAVVWAWRNKGLLFYNEGRYIDAIACCDKAIELDPTYALAWTGKGASLRMLDRLSEAIVCFDRACELGTKDPETWYFRASAEEGLGRERDAVNSLQRFLGLAREPEWQAKIEDARRRLQNLKT